MARSETRRLSALPTDVPLDRAARDGQATEMRSERDGIEPQFLGAQSVTSPNDNRPPLAIAAHWVSQVTGVGITIILPVLIGRYLDQRWGTTAWTLVGAVLGPILGFWRLLTLTGVVGTGLQRSPDQHGSQNDADR